MRRGLGEENADRLFCRKNGKQIPWIPARNCEEEGELQGDADPWWTAVRLFYRHQTHMKEGWNGLQMKRHCNWRKTLALTFCPPIKQLQKGAKRGAKLQLQGGGRSGTPYMCCPAWNTVNIWWSTGENFSQAPPKCQREGGVYLCGYTRGKPELELTEGWSHKRTAAKCHQMRKKEREREEKREGGITYVRVRGGHFA